MKILGKDFKEWHDTAWPEDYIWADDTVLDDGRQLYDEVTESMVLRSDEMFTLPGWWMIEPEGGALGDRLQVRSLVKAWLKERSIVRMIVEVQRDEADTAKRELTALGYKVL